MGWPMRPAAGRGGGERGAWRISIRGNRIEPAAASEDKHDEANSGVQPHNRPWRIARAASIVGASSDSRQAAQHDGTVAMDGGRRSVGDGSGIGCDLVGDTAAYAG